MSADRAGRQERGQITMTALIVLCLISAVLWVLIGAAARVGWLLLAGWVSGPLVAFVIAFVAVAAAIVVTRYVSTRRSKR